MSSLPKHYKCVELKRPNCNNIPKTKTINKYKESSVSNNDNYSYNKSNQYILKPLTEYILYSNALIYNNQKYTKYSISMTKITN